MQAQPPGPGLPIHEPSVMSWTFFMGRSGGDCLELPVEKSIYLIQNLRGLGGLVYFDTQLRSVADAMREVGGKLLHLADGVGRGAFAQHRIIGPHDFVALRLAWMMVRSRVEKLPDLPEDPGIRGGRAADHHGVAPGEVDHSNRVLRRNDVPVADHRNPDCGLYLRDPAPIRLSAVALLAG